MCNANYTTKVLKNNYYLKVDLDRKNRCAPWSRKAIVSDFRLESLTKQNAKACV